MRRCVLLAHYFENDDKLKEKPRVLQVTIAGREHTFHTDSGIFSPRRLDEGTRVLIETIIHLPLEGRMLDLGCGYGPLGIALLSAHPDLTAVLSDINERAVALAKRNIQVAKLASRASAQVSAGCAGIEGTFDLIVTNPPIRTGKETIYGLFREAKERLRPGGRLYIVIRKDQGAASAAAYLDTIFRNVTRISRNKGYHVYEAHD